MTGGLSAGTGAGAAPGALALIDAAVAGTVLVVGSLPPRGRDLDLLVRPDEQRAIEAALARAGFRPRESIWARFAPGQVELVDLTPAVRWRLGPEDEQALFAGGTLLDGRRWLARPAPHHALLVLARLVAEQRGLTSGRSARLRAALEEDPRAWQRAAEAAPRWGAVAALDLLRSSASGGRVGRAASANAIAERRAFEGRSPALARAAGWRRALRRRPRGLLIAFSGLDGSGKSTQAQQLAATLEQLGHEAVVEWSRLGIHPALLPISEALSVPVAAISRASRRGRAEPSGADGGPPGARAAGRRLRESNGLAAAAWASVVAATAIASQRRGTSRHLRAGRSVICDRYTLDSVVHLRVDYPESPAAGLHTRLIRRLSPSPDVAFLLDVAPEVAFGRKGEFSVQRLRRQAGVYRELHARLGVLRLDGERPADELALQIARAVWERV